MKKTFTFLAMGTMLLVAGISWGQNYSNGSATFAISYQIALTDDLMDLPNTSGDLGACFIQTPNVNLNAKISADREVMPVNTCLPQAAQGNMQSTVYYVAPVSMGGDNNNTGTGTDSPWRDIQYAVNHCSSGDTIKVMDDDNVTTDDYTENIFVDKNLTIEKYDSDTTNPRVKSLDPNGFVFFVTADNVIIKGLDIYAGGGAGIFLNSVTGCTIKDNRCGWDPTHNNAHGILVVMSSNNNLDNNTSNYNIRHGIFLSSDPNNPSGSNNNNLTNNTANYNGEDGICLEMGASGNKLTSNTVTHNEFGIFLSESSNNVIIYNMMNYNDGIPDGDGIMLWGSSNNIIANNEANNDPGDGIEFYGSSNNTIESNEVNNQIVSGGWGIRINHSSSNNSLVNNSVSYNLKGIVFQDSSNYNRSYLNSLSINSEDNVFVENCTGNAWNSLTKLSYSYSSIYENYMGNYYDDYSGIDANGDGIGDSPYNATGMTDNYPLMAAGSNYTLFTPTTLSVSSTSGGNVTTPGEGIFTYNKGDTINLVATPDSGYGFYTWTGDVASIADIGAAYTTIIMDSNYSVSAEFRPNLEIISAVPDSVSMNTGETQQLTVTATYGNDSTADVTVNAIYTSADQGVATVDNSGVITAQAAGTTNISISYTEGGATRKDTVSVNVGPTPVVYVEEKTSWPVKIIPNPNRGSFYISFLVNKPKNITLQVINNLGQVIYTKDYANFSGRFFKKFDLSGHEKGTYFIILKSKKKMKVKKVIIE